MHQITIIRRVLAASLRQLIQNPRAIAFGRAGVNRTPDITELICQELHPLQTSSPLLSSPAVFLTLGQGGGSLQQQRLRILRWWEEQNPAVPVAVLSLEREPQRGVLTPVLLSAAGKLEPVHVVKVVGPGMHRLLTPEGQAICPEPVLTPQDRERWSRLIGALGEETWQRLRSLHYCLIGVGRTGSIVAISLARLGIRYLTLSDPDRLELHNLDAMSGVTERDVGRLKVTGVRESLVAISGFPAGIRALPDSITSLRTFVTAKEADILISCVDHDGARLAAGIIATLYAKPLLDIGTGIFGSGEGRQMGGDIRLVLPGERCLLCLGGVANAEQARRIFTAQNPQPRLAWHEERAGSLRSLNQVAAHLGLRLLEDLVGERVQHSTWLHLEFDSHGLPSSRVVAPPENPACPLCRLTGEGDEGLAAVRDVLLTD
jgi:hypothetical protein